MVVGVGVDILKIASIREVCKNMDDPFVKMTYTENELQEARQRSDKTAYFATRFAGKEAVYKALNRNSEDFRLNQVEILTKKSGQPYVLLHGNAKEEAEKAMIHKVLISLSYEEDYAIAFANAISESF